MLEKSLYSSLSHHLVSVTYSSVSLPPWQRNICSAYCYNYKPFSFYKILFMLLWHIFSLLNYFSVSLTKYSHYFTKQGISLKQTFLLRTWWHDKLVCCYNKKLTCGVKRSKRSIVAWGTITYHDWYTSDMMICRRVFLCNVAVGCFCFAG